MSDFPGARLVGWASGFVPRDHRAEWRREWEAEVAYAWRRLEQEGRPSRAAAARLWWRILMCVPDALWERKQTMKMTGLVEDLRFAARSLMRHPTFTLIAVGTLGLGIGANTAVFTLVDGVLLSPLPFPEPNRLVALRHQGREGRDPLPMSQGLYVLYRDEATSLEEIGMYRTRAVNLVTASEPQRVAAQTATPSFFRVLGVEPELGRTFSEEEGAPDGEPVVVLSDGLWRTDYGADPSILDRTLDIDGVARRVVGVMPPDFGHPDRSARLWVPLVVDPANAPLAAFGEQGIARLAPESTVQSASTEIQGLITRLPELFPDSGAPAFLAEVGLKGIVTPLKEAVVGDLAKTLWILLGTVGFVLLIACANVANLLLVRAEGRQRELALRVAVGAGRMQVVRSSMSESVLLAAAGGALGVAIAASAVHVTLQVVPSDLPRIAEIGVDPRVLGFTALIALGCAVFFGLFPLLRYGVDDLAGQLREGSARGATGGRGHHRLRNGLVVVQVALALVLLVGSGLMFRSFQALRALDPGFDPAGVLTARITVPAAEISGWAETAAFFRDLRERIAAQPGVEAVGFAQSAPLTSGVNYFSIEVEDHPRADSELPILSSNDQVEVGYLEAIGIPLLEGRTFQSGDGAEGNRSVVVSHAFAEHWWPGESPLGRRLRLGFQGEEWYRIVGVVGDARYESLEAPPPEIVYWPATVGPAAAPQPTRSMEVVVKTASDPSLFTAVVRREARALNPRIPVSDPRTMDEVISQARSRVSFAMSLLGAASGIALLLGLVGIYGVISYVVSQRTREIGVRMALGATAPSVRGMVVRQGFLLATGGVGIGLVAAAALSSVMASLLFGVSATDPLTYAAVASALVAVSIGASWIPAMRAAGVDPSRALRTE